MEIADGTAISIFEMKGLPMQKWPKEFDLAISLADNTRTPAHIRVVSQAEAVIELRIGTKWRMTRASEDNLSLSAFFRTEGIPTQYWWVSHPL